jgi:hypothetical protein
VPAELFDDITEDHLAMWRTTWVPRVAEAVARLQQRQVPLDKWPQDLHWDWDSKTEWSRGRLALQRYSLVCEGNLQGLMLLSVTPFARLQSQFGKHLAYIEFVSTAPWNRPVLTDSRVFRGVGVTLVRAAVEVSKAESFRGRLGLHSLPQADRFYAEVCGMTRLGPDPAHEGLIYFEMTETQAAAFCRTGSGQ